MKKISVKINADDLKKRLNITPADITSIIVKAQKGAYDNFLIKIPELGEYLVDGLEELKGDNRLDASAIKNLPKFINEYRPILSGPSRRNISQLDGIDITNPTNDQILLYNSTTQKWENKTIPVQTETDPVFLVSDAADITAQDIINLSNLSGVNTGDQDLSGYQLIIFDDNGTTITPHVAGRNLDFLTGNIKATSFTVGAYTLSTEFQYLDGIAGYVYRASGTDVPVADGGTGASSFNVRGVVLGGTTSIGAQQSVANPINVGAYFRSAGSTFNPIWSTLLLPNSATQYYIPLATGNNTWGETANLQFLGGTTLQVTSTTAAQFRAAYSASVYSTFQVASNGDLTVTNNGTSGAHIFASPTGFSSLSMLSSLGKITLGGYGLTNNETLLFDFETTANVVGVSSPSSATKIAFTALDLDLSADDIITDTTTGTKIATGATQKLGFWGATPIVQGAVLTTALTTVTFTAPGTPDYALQDLVDSSAGANFGFATKDEGNTLLSVVANLQARVNDLETRLHDAGIIA